MVRLAGQATHAQVAGCLVIDHRLVADCEILIVVDGVTQRQAEAEVVKLPTLETIDLLLKLNMKSLEVCPT